MTTTYVYRKTTKEDLKGRWLADWNRTKDDYQIENPDSRVLYEMNLKLAEELDKTQKKKLFRTKKQN